MPSSVAYVNWTPIFEWFVVSCGSKNMYEKDVCLQEIWIACSNYDNHSDLNNQHDWRDLYDHSMSTRLFLTMNKIYI